VDGLIAENQRLLNKYVGSLSLKLTEKQWQMHRAELVRKRDAMETEWKKKPLGKKDVVQ